MVDNDEKKCIGLDGRMLLDTLCDSGPLWYGVHSLLK